MSFVTGIGDEVITVTLTFLIMLVVSLVWRSTRVRDRNPILTATFTIWPRQTTQTVETSQTATVVNGGGQSADSGQETGKHYLFTFDDAFVIVTSDVVNLKNVIMQDTSLSISSHSADNKFNSCRKIELTFFVLIIVKW